MSKFQRKTATRVNKKLRLFVSGVPGAGKTPSSLKLAKGLVSHIDNPQILVLDTEYGRASLYADSPGYPKFDVVEWDYAELGSITNKDYIDFIDYAIKERVDIVIIDSISQQWEDIQDIASNSTQRNDMAKWRDAKKENNKLMNKFLYCPVDIIVTCRSKIKTSIDPQTRKPANMGEGAQIETNTPYIFDFVFYVDRESHTAVVEKCPEELEKQIKDGITLNENTGTLIRTWLNEGVDPEKANIIILLKERLTQYQEKFDKAHEASYLDFYKMSVDELIDIGRKVASEIG